MSFTLNTTTQSVIWAQLCCSLCVSYVTQGRTAYSGVLQWEWQLNPDSSAGYAHMGRIVRIILWQSQTFGVTECRTPYLLLILLSALWTIVNRRLAPDLKNIMDAMETELDTSVDCARNISLIVVLNYVPTVDRMQGCLVLGGSCSSSCYLCLVLDIETSGVTTHLLVDKRFQRNWTGVLGQGGDKCWQWLPEDCFLLLSSVWSPSYIYFLGYIAQVSCNSPFCWVFQFSTDAFWCIFGLSF